MLEGINYLHAKFQISILKNKRFIKLLELWTLWLKKENSEYKRVVITTLKRIEKKIAKTRVSYYAKNTKKSTLLIDRLMAFGLYLCGYWTIFGDNELGYI